MAALDSDSNKVEAQDIPQSTPPTAPDGGWGWVVCLAAFFSMVILDGMMFSYGVLFLELLDYFNAGKGQTAMVGSALMGTHLLAGPITSALVNAWGVRYVTMVGAVIATVSFACSIFSQNIIVLTVLYGFIGGIGVSMIYLPSILAVGFYFEKRRALANGITQSGSGLGTFLYAPLTDVLVVEFGWRGTMLILSGVVLNCLACGALYRPIRDTQRKDAQLSSLPEAGESQELESAKLLPEMDGVLDQSRRDIAQDSDLKTESDPSKTVAQMLLRRDHKKNLDVPSIEITTSRSVPNSPRSPRSQLGYPGNANSFQKALLSNSYLSVRNDVSSSKTSLESVPWNMKLLYKKDAFYSGSLSRLPEYKEHKSASLYSLPNGVHKTTSVDHISQHSTESNTCCGSRKCSKLNDIWPMLTNMMALKLMGNPVFLISMMTMVFWTTHSTVLTLLPDCAVLRGVSRDEAAFLLSIIGGANTVARIFAGWLSDRPEVNCLCVNIVALFIGGVSCVAIGFTNWYSLLAVESTVFGLCMGTWTSLRPIILVELLGLDNLTNAFGLVAMFQGVAFLVGPPIAGAFLEWIGSYVVLFILAGVAFMISGSLCCLLHWQPACTRSRDQTCNNVLEKTQDVKC